MATDRSRADARYLQPDIPLWRRTARRTRAGTDGSVRLSPRRCIERPWSASWSATASTTATATTTRRAETTDTHTRSGRPCCLSTRHTKKRHYCTTLPHPSRPHDDSIFFDCLRRPLSAQCQPTTTDASTTTGHGRPDEHVLQHWCRRTWRSYDGWRSNGRRGRSTAVYGWSRWIRQSLPNVRRLRWSWRRWCYWRRSVQSGGFGPRYHTAHGATPVR